MTFSKLTHLDAIKVKCDGQSHSQSTRTQEENNSSATAAMALRG